MLYLHSTYHVEPGKVDEYLDLVEGLLLPANEKRGMKTVGYWTTAGVPGPTTDITAIYELEGWDHWARIQQGAPDKETSELLKEYLAKAQYLRPKWESKFLNPVRFSPLQ